LREVLCGARVDDAALGEGAAQGVLAVGAGLLGREAVAPLVLHDGELAARRRTGRGRRWCRMVTGRLAPSGQGFGPAPAARLRGRCLAGGAGRLWGTRLVVVPRVRREGVVGLRREVLDPLGRGAGTPRLGCALRRPQRALGCTLPGGERRRLLLRGRGRR